MWHFFLENSPTQYILYDNLLGKKTISLIIIGSRLQKTLKSLEVIGPAVLNGGMTTFLALLICAWSTSHIFVMFFKVRFGYRYCLLQQGNKVLRQFVVRTDFTFRFLF